MNWIVEISGWGNTAYNASHSVKDPEAAAQLKAAAAIFWMIAQKLAAPAPWTVQPQMAALLDVAYAHAEAGGLQYQNSKSVAAQVSEWLKTS